MNANNVGGAYDKHLLDEADRHYSDVSDPPIETCYDCGREEEYGNDVLLDSFAVCARCAVRDLVDQARVDADEMRALNDLVDRVICTDLELFDYVRRFGIDGLGGL